MILNFANRMIRKGKLNAHQNVRLTELFIP